MSKASIERIKARIGFERFELKLNAATREQKLLLASKPSPGRPCRVKLFSDAKSAYGQMWEYAVVGGYIESDRGIKAFVIFTERENADGDEDFGFVDLRQIKIYQKEKVHA